MDKRGSSITTLPLKSVRFIHKRTDPHSVIYLFVNTFLVPYLDFKEAIVPFLESMLLKLSDASILEM